MRKYYTRPCNFFYGDNAKNLIKKKKALPLAGNFNIAFDTLEILERKKIEFVPMLNTSKKVTGIFHLTYEDKKPEIENFMIIMAGGIGKRLRPFTYKVPKPLLIVNGKPIIEQIILVAKRQGIKNFIISINYLGRKIKSHLKNGEDLNVNIKYIEENQPMGTAGSL